jgi:peptidase E
MTDTSGQEISKNIKLFNSTVSQLHLTDITKQYIQQQQSIHAFQALWNDIKTACLLSRATTYQKQAAWFLNNRNVFLSVLEAGKSKEKMVTSFFLSSFLHLLTWVYIFGDTSPSPTADIFLV